MSSAIYYLAMNSQYSLNFEIFFLYYIGGLKRPQRIQDWLLFQKTQNNVNKALLKSYVSNQNFPHFWDYLGSKSYIYKLGK